MNAETWGAENWLVLREEDAGKSDRYHHFLGHFVQQKSLLFSKCITKAHIIQLVLSQLFAVATFISKKIIQHELQSCGLRGC